MNSPPCLQKSPANVGRVSELRRPCFHRKAGATGNVGALTNCISLVALKRSRNSIVRDTSLGRAYEYAADECCRIYEYLFEQLRRHRACARNKRLLLELNSEPAK